MILKDVSRGKNYKIEEELGRGTYGRCFLVTDLETREKMACKQIKNLKDFSSEAALHSELNHKHIIKLMGSFEFEQVGYINLELCSNGNLEGLLKSRKYLNNLEVRCIVRQVVDGLTYLHSCLIIHRDIKLLNLLISDSMNIKIADFGLAKKLQTKEEKRQSFCGTSNYASPEIIEGADHSFATDIWALGCVFYVLLVGKEPFCGNSLSETHKNISTISFPKSEKLSKLAYKFLQSIFVYNPSERPNALSVLNHKYFQNKNNLSKLPKSVFGKVTMEAQDKKTPFADIKNVERNPRDTNKIIQENGNDKENYPVQWENKTRCHGMVLRSRTPKLGGQGTSFKRNLNKPCQLQERKLKQLCSHIDAIIAKEIQLESGLVLNKKTFSPFICITRWVTVLNSPAFAYHLSDGSFGVNFEDGLRCHRTQSGNYTYFLEIEPIAFSKKSEERKFKSLVSWTEERKFKSLVSWTEEIRRGMRSLTKSGPKAPFVNIVLLSAWKQLDFSAHSKNMDMAFYLSNGSCQVNFASHEKILVNLEQDLLATWVNSDFKCASLCELLQKGASRSLCQKLIVMKKFLTDLLN